MLTNEQQEHFGRDGFVVVADLFTAKEVRAIIGALEDERVRQSAYERVDAEGRTSRLSIWSDLGEDIFSRVARSRRLVENAVALLGEDVYHWHSKVMFKEPGGGGSWEWHQDYGYWYDDSCLAPQMLSVMVALDPATRENGCLQVLVGSHRLGRLGHGTIGNQAGADPERVRAAEQRIERRYLEADPGTAVFFHCNTLHSSGPNLSANPRRAMICAYNARSNAPFDGSGPSAVPLDVVDDVVIAADEVMS